MADILQHQGMYPKVSLQILDQMQKKWPSHLTYHTLSHTYDVANVCCGYIDRYDIDDTNANLLRIAAICHDIGYLVGSQGHEEVSIEMVRPFLEPVLEKEHLEQVNNMIRATKVPQQPKTFFEEILADSDMDYLGRKDYDEKSGLLYLEFLRDGLIKDGKDWLELQIRFLENHTYFTPYAKEYRAPQKNKKILELRQHSSRR